MTYMSLKREYEALAALLERRGWRRSRHWFYPPLTRHEPDTPRTLGDAVAAELTAAYCRTKRGRT